VLGHSDYYPRFGFSVSTGFGIKSEYDVPEEVFMALELIPGALGAVSGIVRYHGAFGEA
jgi:putative acetyltransferase